MLFLWFLIIYIKNTYEKMKAFGLATKLIIGFRLGINDVVDVEVLLVWSVVVLLKDPNWNPFDWLFRFGNEVDDLKSKSGNDWIAAAVVVVVELDAGTVLILPNVGILFSWVEKLLKLGLENKLVVLLNADGLFVENDVWPNKLFEVSVTLGAISVGLLKKFNVGKLLLTVDVLSVLGVEFAVKKLLLEFVIEVLKVGMSVLLFKFVLNVGNVNWLLLLIEGVLSENGVFSLVNDDDDDVGVKLNLGVATCGSE